MAKEQKRAVEDYDAAEFEEDDDGDDLSSDTRRKRALDDDEITDVEDAFLAGANSAYKDD